MTANVRPASEWIIHRERVVDNTRRALLSIADVELPDGVRFQQHVLRLPRAAFVVVLDDDEHVLMLWRHRFILDRWVWELPGGYLDLDEDPAPYAPPARSRKRPAGGPGASNCFCPSSRPWERSTRSMSSSRPAAPT